MTGKSNPALLIGLGVSIFICLRFLPRIWRAEPRLTSALSKGLPARLGWGPAAARGWVRGYPAMLVGFTTMLVGVNLGKFLSAVVGVKYQRIAALVGVVIGGIGFLIGMLHIPIIAINRPRWAVPPATRDELGVLQSRRKRRVRPSHSNSKNGS